MATMMGADGRREMSSRSVGCSGEVVVERGDVWFSSGEGGSNTRSGPTSRHSGRVGLGLGVVVAGAIVEVSSRRAISRFRAALERGQGGVFLVAEKKLPFCVRRLGASGHDLFSSWELAGTRQPKFQASTSWAARKEKNGPRALFVVVCDHVHVGRVAFFCLLPSSSLRLFIRSPPSLVLKTRHSNGYGGTCTSAIGGGSKFGAVSGTDWVASQWLGLQSSHTTFSRVKEKQCLQASGRSSTTLRPEQDGKIFSSLQDHFKTPGINAQDLKRQAPISKASSFKTQNHRLVEESSATLRSNLTDETELFSYVYAGDGAQSLIDGPGIIVGCSISV
ncbi:hypothetical protein B0H19DRAFT_1065361 [Mycena capillaripes]|nr:hypothetical protein B0H19DRAFT_1065361 [Mycena capillaripes]